MREGGEIYVAVLMQSCAEGEERERQRCICNLNIQKRKKSHAKKTYLSTCQK